MGWRGTLVLLVLVVLAGGAYFLSPTPEIELPDSTVAFVERTATSGPSTTVMLLDRGRVAFLGSPEAFAASTLPAALVMTHPHTAVELQTLGA